MTKYRYKHTVSATTIISDIKTISKMVQILKTEILKIKNCNLYEYGYYVGRTKRNLFYIIVCHPNYGLASKEDKEGYPCREKARELTRLYRLKHINL